MRPVCAPCQNGEDVDSARRCGRKYDGLAEQIDAELFIFDADMHMHAGDHEPPRHELKVLGENVVALLVGVVLALPLGEGVRRRGDRREAELARDAADRGAEVGKLVARFLDRCAHARADLDLRAQEFGADLPAQGLLAFGEQRRRRLLSEVARGAIDKEVFFLDADGEAWFLDRHGGHGGTKPEPSGRA